jgi:alpha-beta hydrolase superfamily lysophospholipase
MAEMLRRGEGSIRGVRGVNLAYRTWEKPNARAALMVVHGLGEHAGRYAEFGERMASFGISTFAMDLRGHGLSDGRRGHVPRFDVHLQEIDRFRREVEGLADLRVPLFLFGQSMGGLIALRYLEEYEGRFRGAIIASPWLATAMPVPRWKVAAASLLNRLLPALPLRHGIEPDHLSHDRRSWSATGATRSSTATSPPAPSRRRPPPWGSSSSAATASASRFSSSSAATTASWIPAGPCTSPGPSRAVTSP